MEDESLSIDFDLNSLEDRMDIDNVDKTADTEMVIDSKLDSQYDTTSPDPGVNEPEQTSSSCKVASIPGASSRHSTSSMLSCTNSSSVDEEEYKLSALEYLPVEVRGIKYSTGLLADFWIADTRYSNAR